MESALGLFNDLMRRINLKVNRSDRLQQLWQSKIHICAYHFVASTDENSYGPGVFALLDDQHVILCSAKGDLLHNTSCAKLLWCQLTESWHNAASCGNGDQLQRKHN